MAQCLKFVLLVTIALHIHVISAKKYDQRICVYSVMDFMEYLYSYCPNFARKRTIGKEGER